MEVLRYDDPAAFRRDGASVLLADAARNNLPLGVLQILLDHPEMYPVFHLWLAVHGGRPVGLALQTEPYNVLLAEPLVNDAVDALAEAAVLDDGRLPGVTANLPWADRFAERVTTLTGREARHVLGEGVWRLTAVADVPIAERRRSRRRRPAIAILLRLDPGVRGRGVPAGTSLGTTPVRTSRSTFDWRSAAAATGSGRTARRSRCPAIATFRAWARASVPSTRLRSIAAEATRRVWSPNIRRPGSRPGIAACFLFTDLANPTSNAIYARIGYTKICDAAEYVFRPTRTLA